MRNLYFFSILLFTNNIFSFASGASEIKLPLPEIETLPNGLKIAWFVNQNIPVIDISLVMNCGFQNDPKGKAGTAELVASTLDRGVQGMNTKELARAVIRLVFHQRMHFF
ncbi:MAG: hypothetical protein HY072_00730 [Deltaproteobacteria bacterium]|nr:hypothetical protein [Deltaproteobacteria bacterium]